MNVSLTGEQSCRRGNPACSRGPAAGVRPQAQAAYNAGIDAQMAGTVWASGCSSWYLDRSGRNRALWPGFTWRFRRLTRRFDPTAYVLVPGPVQPVRAARSAPARASTA